MKIPANLPEMRNVRVEIRERIATVTLDRPPVNALDSVAIRELTAAFNALGRSTEASVIVFTAPGEKIFCGGIDLNDSARRHARQLVEDDSSIDLLDPGAVVRECFWAILECPLPVIAAVNGKAIGAGLVLVASCDMIVCSENASFSVPEIKAGVLGGARHLQRLVGPFKTRRMFFTGETVPAQEFYRLGAVEAVVPPAQLMDAAMELAAQVARNSPIGLRLGKESLSRVEDLSLKDGYRIEQDYTGRVTRYNDSQEARKAYIEKRDPDWSWS
ncbi:enoyl-CoA hydratase-related protein [Metapseudomonas furukawaii]|uniref:enoyl-CoA hydratase-related protein n=1 Tax=Metapseudomonas furukawaii TaxID=1149133 RepID=UPI00227CBC4D|nr:enoyl-CoA hydratase-related protein [Pseudomonas furukawaii]WAG81092.1 enoyl-CoA hydratase-related protein [Pseudomonas furukawaii]